MKIVIHDRKVRSSEIAPGHTKSAGFDNSGLDEKTHVSKRYSNQFELLVIMDTNLNHIRGKSGTFGEHLASDWYDRKCRIYESNHYESPSYHEIWHLTIFTDHAMRWY